MIDSHRPQVTLRREVAYVLRRDGDGDRLERFWLVGHERDRDVSAFQFGVNDDGLICPDAPMYSRADRFIEDPVGLRIRSDGLSSLIPWHQILEVVRTTRTIGQRGAAVQVFEVFESERGLRVVNVDPFGQTGEEE